MAKIYFYSPIKNVSCHAEDHLNPTDPYPLGYKLSDTWPNKL